jgi:uncharacterized delta-60 repeat protein
MTLTPTQQHFTKFYLAAFLRAPELGGLNYWVNQVQSGKSLQEVGGIIFSLPTVIDIYPANLSDTDFVEAIYHNVFGRSSDAEGLGYWTNEIASLRSNFAAQGSTNAAYEARGKLLMNMVDAGLATAEGTDGKAYIENRLDVAEYAIEQQLEQGREIAVTFLQDTLSQVNADTASVSAGQNAIATLLEDKTAPSLLTLEAATSARSGKLTTDFAGYSDLGASLIQQADGKLLLAGIAIEGGYDNFALARYNADGTLDTTFGGGDGKLTTDFAGSYDYGTSLIQQADGKLLLAGSAREGSNSNDNDNFALARYNLDGTLDTSFGGGDGKVTTDFAGSADYGYSLIQQVDGKLLLAGFADEPSAGFNNFALARYNLDGTLDTSFGAERLSALSLSTSENATAGLYDSSNALIGSSLSLSANVAATLEVSAQTSVTQTTLRLTDDAGNSSTGAAVALGTERGDTFNLSSPGYLFGFDGDDALTGSSGADVYIGGSGTDALDLGSDSAVDRVLFDVNGLGFDIITGLVQGAGGDVLDVAALNLGGLALSEVFDTNPGAATDISGQVVRLLDISGGEYIIDIHYSAIAIKTALTIGEYANLDMLANRSALVLTAENSNPGTNYMFLVDSTDTGDIGAVELIGVINNVDIDHWTADNFAF